MNVVSESRYTLLDHEEQLASLEFDDSKARALIKEK